MATKNKETMNSDVDLGEGVYPHIDGPLSKIQKLSLADRSAAERGIMDLPLDKRPGAE